MADSTVNVRPPVALVLGAVIIAGLFYLVGTNMYVTHLKGDGKNDILSQISVSADAKVYASPDIAELSFGVSTGRQSSAKVALAKLSKDMNAVVDAVKKLGIDEKDIQTQSFWMNPEYDYTTAGQVPRGYSASQNLTVKVRDLDKVGDILSAATEAGANQAGGVNFSIDNQDKLQADARQQAIDKAKAKAQELAKQLGIHLGKLQSFSENSGYTPPIRMESYGKAMDMAAQSAPSPVVPSGQQEIQSSVTLTYEIE